MSKVHRKCTLQVYTALTPAIANETRWTGNSTMMKKWDKIQDHVEDASHMDDADIVIPPNSSRFKKAVKNTKLCFDDIHATTLTLQERLLPLAKCRESLEELMKEVNDNRDEPESCWYKNEFGKVYIPNDSEKRPIQYRLAYMYTYI